MVERIDNLSFSDDATLPEGRKTNLYITGPAEFLAEEIAIELAKFSAWTQLFGDQIVPNLTFDYSFRSLPAMRIYNESYSQNSESWHISGDMIFDMIFPASLRRIEIPRIIQAASAAFVQQLRSKTFFASLVERVPGLSRLGKMVRVDKSMAFEFKDDLVPFVQIRCEFQIDLEDWDKYLESQDRTQEAPFEQSLGDLERLVGEICGIDEDDQEQIIIGVDQDIVSDE